MTGPNRTPRIEPYTGPAGGYGSVRSVSEVLLRQRVPLEGSETIFHQNKPGGYMCVSCAWGKPAEPHPVEVCENGVKATAWEITRRRADEAFFEAHTLRELEGWDDFDLENQGRITHPLRWDPATDKYRPVAWEAAFEEIGRELAALRATPDATVFYTSGRASLEASYMYQLFARLYGTNNLPDSSNMCHESTSVALPESIGVTVGTVTLEDFEQTDLVIYAAHNPGTSSPRILHQLQGVVRRGGKILGINPLKERGLERFKNPQSPFQMLSPRETRLASEIHQVRSGGDIALLTGVCKALIAADDQLAPGAGSPVLDHAFIREHTQGFEAFADYCRQADWSELEQTSGIDRSAMERLARDYAAAERTIFVYGMGLTQHVAGVQNVQMVCNLLLLRGNIGKPGAGICPVRGHSNVQGQRTVGITEKPELAPLEQLEALYGFEPPRNEGVTTVTACEKMISGEVKAFVALGGNFVRAAPDIERVEAAWRKLRLTVAVATKLNRSHVAHGEVAFLLPCLGRIEIDVQATGPQAVSMESSVAHFHGSNGHVKPASPHLRSEPAIIAALAKATLAPNPAVPWDEWVGDYSRVRTAIEKTWPAIFEGLNENMWKPGGMIRPLAARERKWNTRTGKANFIVPTQLFAGHIESFRQPGVFQLTTFRSNDQFNTTVYGFDDRFRGVKGTRTVVFMNPADMQREGYRDGDLVDIRAVADDAVERAVRGFRVTTYDIPEGCVGAYFPEANPLIPLGHHDRKALTPAYKATPVRLARSGNA